jgi:hypothetical protein
MEVDACADAGGDGRLAATSGREPPGCRSLSGLFGEGLDAVDDNHAGHHSIDVDEQLQHDGGIAVSAGRVGDLGAPLRHGRRRRRLCLGARRRGGKHRQQRRRDPTRAANQGHLVLVRAARPFPLRTSAISTGGPSL